MQPRDNASTTRTDALVLFGATGDLALKKIFPALQSMAKLRTLDQPVIAVTSSDWGKDEAHGPGAGEPRDLWRRRGRLRLRDPVAPVPGGLG